MFANQQNLTMNVTHHNSQSIPTIYNKLIQATLTFLTIIWQLLLGEILASTKATLHSSDSPTPLIKLFLAASILK